MQTSISLRPHATHECTAGAEAAAHPSLVKFAAQCLHNCTSLCDKSLDAPTTPAQDPPHPQSRVFGSVEAGANPSDGLPYPSNGHRDGASGPARSAVGKGSAAEAAEQLAMLSLDRSRAASSKLSGPRCIWYPELAFMLAYDPSFNPPLTAMQMVYYRVKEGFQVLHRPESIIVTPYLDATQEHKGTVFPSSPCDLLDCEMLRHNMRHRCQMFLYILCVQQCGCHDCHGRL